MILQLLFFYSLVMTDSVSSLKEEISVPRSILYFREYLGLFHRPQFSIRYLFLIYRYDFILYRDDHE